MYIADIGGGMLIIDEILVHPELNFGSMENV